MQNKFDLALASVIGSEHVRLGLNNQDALLASQDADCCLELYQMVVDSVLEVRLGLH